MFEIVGPLRETETIAVGRGIREMRRLQKTYGVGRWRKLKGLVHSDSMASSGQRKFTGTKRMASAAKKSRSSGSSHKGPVAAKAAASDRAYVLCLSNAGHAASLEARKIYRSIADEAAEQLGLFRVIDESGEDYLFPRAMFARIRLPVRAIVALSATS